MRLRVAALLVVPVWIALAMWLAATGECGAGASCVATARVDDGRYAVANARGMSIKEADLTPYAVAKRVDAGSAVIDKQTYRLGSIDPMKVLVMKLVPGQSDDAGPIGDYLLLVADASGWALTCPYYAPNAPTRPEQCP